MEDVSGVLVVPDILLQPMRVVQYQDFMRKVIIANAPVEVDLLRMRSLWASVISMAYSHECECERQKMLAMVSYPYLQIIFRHLTLPCEGRQYQND